MKIILVSLLFVYFGKAASAQYALQEAFPNLPLFSLPLDMQMPGDGTNRIFIVQQKGKIYLFQNTPTVNTRKLFLDLSTIVSPAGGERGLLGLAFHPNFKVNGFFYVHYTTDSAQTFTSYISRFQVNPSNPDSTLLNSEKILLTIAQPFSHHNGGCLAFGLDGYLYASYGDGEIDSNGQSKYVLLGKMLRLNVDKEENGKQYAIPADNPFVNNTLGFKPEIYAYGLRNAWKFSFDIVTGKLWASDVGADSWEEIDLISNGNNYGWSVMEGLHRYDNYTGDTTQMTLPIWEYPHTLGNASITGGYIYRGNALPDLVGKYIYGDFMTGRVYALQYNGVDLPSNQLLIDTLTPRINLSSFGQDLSNEIYLISYDTKKIYKLVLKTGVENISQQNNFTLSAQPTLCHMFHPFTEVHFTLPKDTHVTMELIDVTGHGIHRYLDNEMGAGEHTYQMQMKSLSNGIYFIRLNTNIGSLTQKVLVFY